MRYLLDTDTCIYLIKRKPKSVLIRLLQVSLGAKAQNMRTYFSHVM